jgi:hypothetical protein
MLEAQPTPPEPEPASDVTEQREEQQPPQPDRAPLPDALRGTRRYLPPGALPHLPSMLPEQQHAHSTRVFSSHSASSSVMAALQVSLDTPGARDSTSPTKVLAVATTSDCQPAFVDFWSLYTAIYAFFHTVLNFGVAAMECGAARCECD